MEYLEIIPIHHCLPFLKECCDLINSEWPRSIPARMQSLCMSSDKFPISLVLILNERQLVGHVKLTEIQKKGPDVMLECMIIHKNHRGKGWGRILMAAAEKFVERKGKKKIYLSTKGQEGFYKKLGYEICEPIYYFGFCDVLTPKVEDKVEKIIKNCDLVNEDRKNSLSAESMKINLSVPLPPPPPPLPMNNKKKPEIRKTTKTFLCKPIKSEIIDNNITEEPFSIIHKLN